MESSVLKNTASVPGLRAPSPLLRLAPDERLIALARRGQQTAFEAIVARYQSRLLAFCRHMLASREDAEDVLQEVFTAAFNAILADDRPINVRPWLYRIARNRCLNHLRRQTAIGVDSMDVHFADAGQSTVEKAAGREDFRLLMADIRRLPETQRTALLLREMDALSYEQIAEAMETTVPGIKSLLVRARVSLGEAAEARKLTCADVRLELGAIAEGLSSMTSPLRRHVKDCQRCRDFRFHLRANNRVLAAALPVGPLLFLKKIALTKFGLSAGSGGAGAAGVATAAGGAATAVTGAGATGGGFAGVLAAGTLASKAVAGLAAAALVTAGAAVEVHRAPHHHPAAAVAVATTTRIQPREDPIPAVAFSVPQPTTTEHVLTARMAPRSAAGAAAKLKTQRAALAGAAAAEATTVAGPIATAPALPPAPTIQQISQSSVLPPQPAPAAPPAVDASAPQIQVIVQGSSIETPPPAAGATPTSVPATAAPQTTGPAASVGPRPSSPATGAGAGAAASSAPTADVPPPAPSEAVVPGGTVLDPGATRQSAAY